MSWTSQGWRMGYQLRTVLRHLIRREARNTSSEPKAGTCTSDVEPNFRFTLNNPKLTLEQRTFYEDNGFLVVKKLVSPQKLEKYRRRFEQICKREVTVPGLTIMRDIAIAKFELKLSEKAVSKIHDFQNDKVLFEYCCLPEVVNYVECFTGSKVLATNTMLINKPPDAGKKTSRHPMHQDLYYFPFRPADRIVCSWTAMEPVNRQNGCLVFWPGTHKGDLLPHEYPKWEGGVNKMYHGIRDYDRNHPQVYMEMAPGDTVFFHSLLIHGSGMNRTNGFRKSISCHYTTGECEYIEVNGTSQEDISKEWLDVALGKAGIPPGEITYQDIWKNKSRLVKGADKSTLRVDP